MPMKTTQTPSENEVKTPRSIFDKLDEAYYGEWFTKYGRTILLSFAIIFTLIVILMRLGLGSKGNSEGDYLKVQKELALVQKGDDSAFNELNNILLRKSDLQAKYDGQIAQALLNRHRLEEARPLVDRTLRRTSRSGHSFYADYTRISLLIGEGKYEKALEATKVLKESMLENAKTTDRNFGDLLFAYNLLRLGLLNRKVGNFAEEKETWQELKGYAHLEEAAPPTDLFSPSAFLEMISQYEEGKTSLLHYIDKRESV